MLVYSYKCVRTPGGREWRITSGAVSRPRGRKRVVKSGLEGGKKAEWMNGRGAASRARECEGRGRGKLRIVFLVREFSQSLK